MKSALPRRMDLPPEGRPYWFYGANAANHDLLFLGWGERKYGDNPCQIVRHLGWLYIVVEHGTPTFVSQSEGRQIPAGNAVIVGPDCASGWNDTPGRACRVLSWMWRRPATSLLPADQPTFFRQVVVPPSTINRLQSISEMCREQIRLLDPVMPMALYGLHCILEAILLQSPASEITDDHRGQRIDLAIRWMESHLECRQPAARIADYLGISPSTLYRLFTEQLGSSPEAHFHSLKMAAARRWLGEHRQVKDVAYGLGYRHPSDFTRAYTRFYGEKPGAVRQ